MAVKLIAILFAIGQLVLAVEDRDKREFFTIPATQHSLDNHPLPYEQEASFYGPKKHLSLNGLLPKQDDYEITDSNPVQIAALKAQLAQPRQNLFGLSNINNQINPFAAFFSSKPALVIRNPDTRAVTNLYESCQDSNGVYGTCVGPLTCAGLGGRLGGSCGFGTVCCVNTVAKCGGQITLNNTYWTPPKVITGGGTCGVTLTLDPNLIEQKRRICQVKLDFLSFSIAQPNKQTVCDVDNFQVGGTLNKVPLICGENSGQHMYLHAQSTTDLQLLFNLGTTNVERSWNIRISFLPCGASYLAPMDCLQYFTSVAGQVTSFNWKDVAGTGSTSPAYQTRQLANQNYRICFRSEILESRGTNMMCLTACAAKNTKPFSISEPSSTSQSSTTNCHSDYLIFAGGYDPAPTSPSTANHMDRFCGERFNVAADSSNKKVCSLLKPFAIHYVTNGIEQTTDSTNDNVDSENVGNIGFCLEYAQTF